MNDEKISEAKKLIEAALFISAQPLTLSQLHKIIKDIYILREALKKLTEEYSQKDSALFIEETINGFQMRIKPEYSAKVSIFAPESELSKSVLKTLAIIAVKQPIKQSDLIKYRSNKAYDEVKILLEKGYISKEPKGRTFLLRTTKKFLTHFGSSLKQYN